MGIIEYYKLLTPLKTINNPNSNILYSLNLLLYKTLIYLQYNPAFNNKGH